MSESLKEGEQLGKFSGEEIGGWWENGIGQQDNSKRWLGERERARNEGYVCMPIATSKRVTIVSVMGNALATGPLVRQRRANNGSEGKKKKKIHIPD